MCQIERVRRRKRIPKWFGKKDPSCAEEGKTCIPPGKKENPTEKSKTYCFENGCEASERNIVGKKSRNTPTKTGGFQNVRGMKKKIPQKKKRPGWSRHPLTRKIGNYPVLGVVWPTMKRRKRAEERQTEGRCQAVGAFPKTAKERANYKN